MNILLGVLIGIFCLMFLVTAHEFGHFIMARRSGVRVVEFGICFPPRAVAWTKGKDGKWHKIPRDDWQKPQEGLIFSLNLLPIGGFCQMDGESDADTKKATFGAATFWQKTKILFGGVFMNWLIAFLIFTLLAWIGMPIFLDNQFSIDSDKSLDYSYIEVTNVAENSPADRAGFKPGDKILKINGEEVYTAYDEAFSKYPGEEVSYEIQRDLCKTSAPTKEGEIAPVMSDCAPDYEHWRDFTLTATLNEVDNEWGYLLGVSMSSSQVYARYSWSAPIVGFGTTLQLTGETFKGVGELLWNLVSGAAKQLSFNKETRESGQAAISSASEGVTGPIGIIGVLFPSFAKTGFSNIAFLFALISVSLACMNVLPIPALDGGRWLMIFLSRLRHKRLTKETEEKIVARAMIVLLILMAIITILDITRLF